jgi:hypothetical protein
MPSILTISQKDPETQYEVLVNRLIAYHAPL